MTKLDMLPLMHTQKVRCTPHRLCNLVLRHVAMLYLANMKMVMTIDNRAAAVLIMPLGCSMSFLHSNKYAQKIIGTAVALSL